MAIYEIYTNHRYGNTSYTIIKLDTVKDIEEHIFKDSKRRKIENLYGTNLIFVTDDKGGSVHKKGTKKQPFEVRDLLSLTFVQVDIEDN